MKLKTSLVSVLLLLSVFVSSSDWSKSDIVTYYNTTDKPIKCAWDAVPEATGYEARLFHLERNVEVTLPNGKTTSTEIIFKLPRTGHFVFKVRACVNNYELCSDWCEASNPDCGLVDGQRRGWWIYGFVAPPGPITIP